MPHGCRFRELKPRVNVKVSCACRESAEIPGAKYEITSSRVFGGIPAVALELSSTSPPSKAQRAFEASVKPPPGLVPELEEKTHHNNMGSLSKKRHVFRKKNM
eukprot:INCI946.1.p2 GENE.INCI946.1~~INCI946.1.p2  ORF type:complete len:103 (-),score=15.73 INCI946.1:285-593(-)